MTMQGMAQGVAVLRDLAQSPATARHVSAKLARHFIADDPPPAAIDRLSKVFLSTNGDLPSVYRALIELPEAWTEPLSKFKSPSDYIYSTYRALELPVPEGPKALAPFELLGQRVFSSGLTRRLAGPVGGLGRLVGDHEAPGVGGSGGPARRFAHQYYSACAADARGGGERAQPHRHRPG